MNKIKFYWNVISPALGILIMGVVMFFTLGLLLSIPLCLLWNWLMPFIFGLPKLNLLETFGLSILISLLAPRKLGLPKKDITSSHDINEAENKELNETLEDLLQDLSSQFNA